jgi:drug/metabolite transporter (DMT)-like permease
MTEPIEQLHLVLGVTPHRMVFREVDGQLANPRAELVGEVRRRRPDELVDRLSGRLGHGESVNGTVGRMRGRLTAVELMLGATIVIWAFNIVVTKYVLEHGFEPLAYASLRYIAAALLAAAAAYLLEGSLRIGGRSNLLLIGLATGLLLANQVAFVYSLKLTTATTVALILGTTPIFAALISSAVGLERLPVKFWAAALVTFVGVALVALGSGGDLSSDLVGDLLAVGLAATWAGYSVTVAPLIRVFSPYRVSAVVLLAMGIPLVGISLPQLHEQSYSAPNMLAWLGLAFAIVGPLALTNVLWFTAIARVGPARATLFANFQPFIAAVFALLLLSERLHAAQAAGGLLIAAGIMLERGTRPVILPAAE